jgi:hypothetical protein
MGTVLVKDCVKEEQLGVSAGEAETVIKSPFYPTCEAFGRRKERHECGFIWNIAHYARVYFQGKPR